MGNCGAIIRHFSASFTERSMSATSTTMGSVADLLTKKSITQVQMVDFFPWNANVLPHLSTPTTKLQYLAYLIGTLLNHMFDERSHHSRQFDKDHMGVLSEHDVGWFYKSIPVFACRNECPLSGSSISESTHVMLFFASKLETVYIACGGSWSVMDRWKECSLLKRLNG